MSKIDFIYHDLSKAIIDYGYWYKDDSRDKRCKQISSATLSIPLNKFPLLTTKKMFTKGIVGELIWFLRGDSNIKYLIDNKINIWNDDAYKWYSKRMLSDKEFSAITGGYVPEQKEFVGQIQGGNDSIGDVGRNYGVQWRDWTNSCDDKCCTESIDQIFNLINNIKKKPIGRRHIVTAWNPAEIDQTALPPCHWAWEVIPRPLFDFEKKLYPNQEYGFDLKWHQRSVDTFLGLPFNIASYALLAHIIGKLVNFVPLNIIGDLSNVHFYEPHIEIVIEQLQRDTNLHEGCDLLFSERFENSIKQYQEGNLILDNFFKELEINDFKFDNYTSFDKLKADMYAPIKE